MNHNLSTIIRADAWRAALEKYGGATGTTIAVYAAPESPMLGPVHATPLFETMSHGREAPAMFTECVRECLASKNIPVILENRGVAVIGVGLRLAGAAVGAVVAGYGLTTFPDEAMVRRFAQGHGLAMLPVWRAIRRQAPLTAQRLRTYGELLVALTETLLSENFRSQQHQETATRLAQAVQAKDQFLAMLAHELRNPLAPIRIATQIISMRDTSNPPVQKAREIIDRQVGHLTRLLDDLFDVSRVTSGKVQLRKEAVNLATAVANALEASRGIIQERTHSLSVSLPDEPLFVDADPVRLEQVIINLVNNAARYTPPNGHIAVTATREAGEAVLHVRDDGIGIHASVLPHVFDLFTQGDRSLARSEGGLGIGLTIVRNLVELHGGTITAQSEGPGRGSEFIVRLPLGTPRDVRGEPSVNAAAVVPRLNILVIEDNPDGREILRVMLEEDGHQIRAAEDGRSGVELARATRPDVALVDIGLPGLDGYEVARQIRRELGTSIRLIAVTGYGQADDRRKSRDAGFDAHLVKPVAPEALRGALAQCPPRSS
jgi:signal transduction histidine kinase/CheY-like chemotaxis protein